MQPKEARRLKKQEEKRKKKREQELEVLKKLWGIVGRAFKVFLLVLGVLIISIGISMLIGKLV